MYYHLDPGALISNAIWPYLIVVNIYMPNFQCVQIVGALANFFPFEFFSHLIVNYVVYRVHNKSHSFLLNMQHVNVISSLFFILQVVGHSHNNTDIEKSSAIKDMYETIYALLEHISPSYVLNFADAVASKLQSEINALSDET